MTRFLFVVQLIIALNTKAFCSDFIHGNLSNGLTYYIHQDLESKKHISLDLVVRAGPAYETEHEREFSHVIEHLIYGQLEFKEKKLLDPSCDFWDLSMPLPEIFTTQKFTQFHLKISRAFPEGVEQILSTISSAISKCHVDPTELQIIKQELAQEWQTTQSSPLKRWKMQRDYQEGILYHDPQTTEKSIMSIVQEPLHRFYKTHYQPQNMALVVVGKVDVEKVEQLIKTHFGPLIPTSYIRTPFPSPQRHSSSTYFDPQLDNHYFSLTKKLPIPLAPRDLTILRMQIRHLHQRLQAFLTEYNLHFSNPLVELLYHTGILRITVSFRNFLGVRELEKILTSIFNTPLTQSQLDQLKTGIKHSLQQQPYPSTLPLSELYRDHFILGYDDLTPPSYVDLIEQIQLEEINQSLSSLFSSSSISCALREQEDPELLKAIHTALGSYYDH